MTQDNTYKIVKLVNGEDIICMMEDDDKWYEQLNGFGKQGWESYAVIKDGNTTNFYLKRPIKKTQ